MKSSYQKTIYACYFGYITQGIVNNLAPLLFLTFINSGWASLKTITLLSTVNFLTQLLTDLLSAHLVDKIGYRVSIVAAHILAALGLIGIAVLPEVFPIPFVGLLISVMIYAVGGGLLEVLVSPIVEACPSENKAGTMSLLHSFYCWGVVAVVALSTAFLFAFGQENWRVLCWLWAILPLCNAVVFTRVPIYSLTESGEGMTVKELLRSKLFWLFALLMLAAGSSELAMSQWASAFAESGLRVSKAVGDLAGPCAFAVLMGLARVLYGKYGEKIKLESFILVSGGVCVLSYALASFIQSPMVSLIGCGLCGFSVGIMWPGVYSIASASMPRGGTAMFAMLALAGDLGCTAGPTLVGFASSAFGDSLKDGLKFGIISPLILIFGILSLKRLQKNK